MTIEEKSKKLEEWCKNTQKTCRDCILRDESICYAYGDEVEATYVSKNYKMLFGDDETEEQPVADDHVNHPAHYQGKNECIDVMIAMFGKEAVKHFCMCNAYKYRFRADKKNGEQDIAKAEWYETKLIELGGRDESKNTVQNDK